MHKWLNQYTITVVQIELLFLATFCHWRKERSNRQHNIFMLCHQKFHQKWWNMIWNLLLNEEQWNCCSHGDLLVGLRVILQSDSQDKYTFVQAIIISVPYPKHCLPLLLNFFHGCTSMVGQSFYYVFSPGERVLDFNDLFSILISYICTCECWRCPTELKGRKVFQNNCDKWFLPLKNQSCLLWSELSRAMRRRIKMNYLIGWISSYGRVRLCFPSNWSWSNASPNCCGGSRAR